jgi:heat shock protein HslJ
MRRSLVLIATLGLTLIACAEGDGAPADPPTSDPTASAWELESGALDGSPIPILGSHPITLSFTEDGAGGTAACNGYGGSYSISGNELTLSEVFQTEMACMPEETMESEQKYLEALGRVAKFTMTEVTLTLVGEGVELRYVLLPRVPTSELTGTVWVLDGLVGGDAVSSVGGERATLELFSDGSLLGSTGCRSLNGSYTISGAEVRLTDLAVEGECPAGLQQQDDQVVTVLGDGFRATVDGQTLTLTIAGDEGLIYKAGD